MKLGDTIFNGNAFKNIILNSKSYKRMILGTNLVWSYFGIAINAFRTRISADSGTYEAESILEDKLQEITPNLFDSASLVITPNGVKTSKLYSIKPNDATGDLSVVRNTSATRIDDNGNIVNVPANMARIDYTTGSPAILVEPQRTNLVYPSDIATTQVRAVTAQVYTLSFYGTGTVILSGAYSGSLVGTGINKRVSLTFTPTAGNLTLTVNGSVTNWQLEAGSNATSVIKTISGSVTRNADNISKNGIIDLIGQTEGTIYYNLSVNSINNPSKYIVLSDGTTNNRIAIGHDTSGSEFRLYYNSSGITSFTYTGSNWATGVVKKIAIVYATNNFKLFIDGVLVYTKNSITTFNSNNLTNFQITATVDFKIDTIGLWKTALTNTQAIQLTTL